jgi:hypothetical protein
VRSEELRDIRTVSTQPGDRLRSEIQAARADLSRAKALCATLLASTERAIGLEALTRLRRDLVRRVR